MNKKITAIYVRVSSGSQSIKSQMPDLERWANSHDDEHVKWFTEKCSGKSMAGSCSVKDYFNCAVLIILDDLVRAVLFLGHVSKLTLLCYPMLSFNR